MSNSTGSGGRGKKKQQIRKMIMQKKNLQKKNLLLFCSIHKQNGIQTKIQIGYLNVFVCDFEQCFNEYIIKELKHFLKCSIRFWKF